ncbi:helix-turn-helix domain-containing protein [Enterococcus sp. HY326]|uniref:helix-turn-helix domain-containing protein n=1 Tax=Enterococcus sp. HY326 TaxID=2971265 RepID=UPI00223F02DF|nr:helix-turn-helix transcriptional regulator [Enterococcus sp. HY326]
MHYGKNLKAVRRAKRVSQETLATGIMSRSNLSNFENELYIPSFDKVLELLRRLNISVEEFLALCSADYQLLQNLRRQIIAAEALGDLATIKKINHRLANLAEKNLDFADLFLLTNYVLFIAGEDTPLTYLEIKEQAGQTLLRNDIWYSQDFRQYNNFFHLYALAENQIFYYAARKKYLREQTLLETPYLVNLSLNYFMQLAGLAHWHEAREIYHFTEELIDQHQLNPQRKILDHLRYSLTGTIENQQAIDEKLLHYLQQVMVFAGKNASQ